MKNALQKNNSNWNYEDSVKTTKFLVTQFKKCSLDIVRELYQARENLAAPGYRSDLRNEVSTSLMKEGFEFHTFKEYLEEIGLSHRTAYSWLALYSPTEEKLYSAEEMKLKITNLFEEVYEIRTTNPLYKPEGWDFKQESAYRKWEERTHPTFISSDIVQKEAKEFDREYLNILSREMENPTPDDIMRQMQLCQTYQSIVSKKAPVQEQMHIVRYVEKALEMFDEENRDDIALAIAKVLQLEVINRDGE